MSTLDTFLITVAMIAVPSVSMAQFHTITKETPIEAPSAIVNIKEPENVGYTESGELAMTVKYPDSIQIAFRNAGMVRKSCEEVAAADNLPPLTIQNLIAEIEKNGIKYPKIVLAQYLKQAGSNLQSAATSTTFSGLPIHAQANTMSSTTGPNR